MDFKGERSTYVVQGRAKCWVSSLKKRGERSLSLSSLLPDDEGKNLWDQKAHSIISRLQLATAVLLRPQSSMFSSSAVCLAPGWTGHQ